MKKGPRTLIVGTHNADKLRELRHLLEGSALEAYSLGSFPGCPEAKETGRTFEANARLKARLYGRYTGMLTIADDSGLSVRALNGRPGVYSARFAGPGCTYADNNAKLLRLLKGKRGAARRAKFVCVIAIYDGARFLGTVRGECEGRIAEKVRGAKGFGYDPVFIPNGYTQTFAELSRARKGAVSHRGKALRAARRRILSYLSTSR